MTEERRPQRQERIKLRGSTSEHVSVERRDWVQIRDDYPWVRFGNVPGWEAFEFSVLTCLVDGVPRMIGVKIEPASRDLSLEAAVLGSRRMASLPVGQLARRAGAVIAGGTDAYFEVAGDAAAMPRPPNGSVEWAEQVAEVFQHARAAGESGQRAVQDYWSISRQTAEGWIKEARTKFKTLPPSARSRRSDQEGA